MVSTEEEFDWCGPFDSRQREVGAAKRLPQAQVAFDALGVRPTYVIDHPIATTPSSAELLRAFVREGRCEVGAHLHPWVNPPLRELLGSEFSYPGNLPPELEREKLAVLVGAIEDSIGVRPRSYQAGRYGFGRSTAALLEELGFAVDLSCSSAFDFSADGGPDHSRVPSQPIWFGERREVLGVPITGAHVGFAGSWAAHLHRHASRPALQALRAPAVLARLRFSERLRLSPEGFDLAAMLRLTRSLRQRGTSVFALSLHSPSFHPGCTPYVRSEADLRRLFDTCGAYYRHFFDELGGRHLTASELYDELTAQPAEARA
ncbi:MAG: WalW protein [Planctomycetes bacterium]|nr:WalW protein [Planctomycetota bacterium]